MNLSEFIKNRLAEMGKNKNWLVNFGDVEWGTLSNIDKGRGISKATQEKLANALGCTQGDIQACLAEQNPLKNVIVNKKSLAKLNAKKESPAPDPKDEEPAEVFQQDAKEDATDELFPAYHSVYEEDKQEDAREYRQKLRDLCFRIFATSSPGVHDVKDVYADIGYAMMQELNKELAEGGEKDEIL